MTTMRIAELAWGNVRAACDLKVKPEQAQLVAPVAISLAEAYVVGDAAWPRVVYDGDRLVGFVMAGFAPAGPAAFRCNLWRLLIAADQQGKGYGRFAVEAVIQEARRRGHTTLHVFWSPGEDGPQKFYLRLGFRPNPDWDGRGEVPGRLDF
ncbi:MAG TPA: GNAT family N-acetyltransferase [Candidatus Saccharimonadales bacterium]|nr:GNAT family N-acetyltransferase [Candidatus Saccharimonadales bacterium]